MHNSCDMTVLYTFTVGRCKRNSDDDEKASNDNTTGSDGLDVSGC